jgi:hypothetical protein
MSEEENTNRITSLEEIKDPEAFLKAYYKAMDDAKETREENKTLRTQVESTSDEEVNKWKSRAVKAEAKVNLEGQGIKGADRILKYLNLDGVDFDDDGNLTGLDDKVTEVKKDFPELFDPKIRAGRQSVDIHTGKPTKTPMTGTQAQVARIFKK